ncbi:hypothetical protein HDV00_004298 [Rhizophlyctis rosea]|nr:hypothetical protein HDV00_004298 [Rhizophlyctis rosea]
MRFAAIVTLLAALPSALALATCNSTAAPGPYLDQALVSYKNSDTKITDAVKSLTTIRRSLNGTGNALVSAGNDVTALSDSFLQISYIFKNGLTFAHEGSLRAVQFNIGCANQTTALSTKPKIQKSITKLDTYVSNEADIFVDQYIVVKNTIIPELDTVTVSALKDQINDMVDVVRDSKDVNSDGIDKLKDIIDAVKN